MPAFKITLIASTVSVDTLTKKIDEATCFRLASFIQFFTCSYQKDLGDTPNTLL